VETGEFALIAELARRFPLVGDDCAVVPGTSGSLLLAADAIVEGVDFLPGASLRDVGYRAVVVNVSDVAAMGGRPSHLLVTVCAPPGADVLAVMNGVEAAATAHGCEVAGGDLSATAGPLVVSIAVTGTVDGEPVRRSGARAGDVLYVTGPLGAAAAAGYPPHLHDARVAEGAAARSAGATAMIDVSDGLAADLAHLADASGVGVVVEHVPVADGATPEHALGGGDDYELVFTLPAGVPPPPGSIRIGTITADPSQRPPAVPGWKHGLS
jgi:thiamine-monophosphate kinase